MREMRAVFNFCSFFLLSFLRKLQDFALWRSAQLLSMSSFVPMGRYYPSGSENEPRLSNSRPSTPNDCGVAASDGQQDRKDGLSGRQFGTSEAANTLAEDKRPELAGVDEDSTISPDVALQEEEEKVDEEEEEEEEEEEDEEVGDSDVDDSEGSIDIGLEDSSGGGCEGGDLQEVRSADGPASQLDDGLREREVGGGEADLTREDRLGLTTNGGRHEETEEERSQRESEGALWCDVLCCTVLWCCYAGLLASHFHLVIHAALMRVERRGWKRRKIKETQLN